MEIDEEIDIETEDSNRLVVVSDSSDEDDKPPQTTNKLPLWRIVLLSAVGGTVDLLYAVEGVYAVPLLVGVGLDIHYAGIMLGLSPILGIICQSYLGALSDQCKCRWGRRRPFILFIVLTACLGLLIAPFASFFLLVAKSLAILFTIFGIVVLDLSAGQLQLPSRAYLLDSVPANQTQVANFIYALLIGLGTLIGYVLSGIDWSMIFNRDVSVASQAQIVFSISVGFVILSLICTLVSVKEKPAGQPQDDEKRCCCEIESFRSCLKKFWKIAFNSVKFFVCMSKYMWILWFCAFFGFSSCYSFLLFFSTFVGRSVYGGISDAPADSKAYYLYTEGVRMSSWAFAVGGGFLIVFSLISNYIVKVIGMKMMFISVQCVFIVVLFFQVLFTNIVVSFLAAVFFHLFLGIYMSVPFTLLSIYEDQSVMFRKPINDSNGDNIKGQACFVINCALFLGQIAATFIGGPLIELFESATTCIMMTSVFAALATTVSAIVKFQ
jgi:solute carrier family 45 protein 1/2/4